MMSAAFYGERAKALSAAGKYFEAEDMLRIGLRAFPEQPILSYALGILLLRRGQYQDGWPLYEYRWALRDQRPSLSFPEWRGQQVRSLLLIPEQGFGDQIMFARYAPALQRNGIEVTLMCPPALADLFTELGVRLLITNGTISVPRHDAWALLGSLPLRTGDIPSAPYLQGSSSGNGIGIVTRGRTQGAPDFASALPAIPGSVSLLPEDTGARTFGETAKIIRDLAEVITIDTAVAHLAGAMGKPLTVLLPPTSDWRWGGGSRSDWYPNARLWRPTSPTDRFSLAAGTR